MPKYLECALTRANEFSAEGMHSSDRKVMFCKYCNTRVSWERRDTVIKHIKSDKHVNNRRLSTEKKTSLQQSLGSSFQGANKRKAEANNFALKTTAAFLKANIPLEKLEQTCLREWMDEIVQGAGDLPTVKTLREKYVPLVAEEQFATIKAELAGKFVTVLADETTDKRGKCVFIVLFSLMEPTATQKNFLVGIHFLETANSTLCSRAVLDSLKKYNVSYDSVLAFVSDGARYMSKCCECLKVILADRVLHVQCWAHKLCIIGNIWPKVLAELNSAVVKFKAAFQNTRKRKHLYTQFLTEKYPDGSKKISLFPVPVLTRWNSGFQSVLYVSQYLTDMIEFFNSTEMQATSNAGVEYFSKISKSELLKIQIQAVFVREHAEQLMSLVDCLEGSLYPTSHILHIKLLRVKEGFQVAANGIFETETMSSLQEVVNQVLQAEMKQTLQRVVSLAADKLQELMFADPCKKTFEVLGKLFNPSSVVLNDINENLITSFQTLPGTKVANLSSADVARGYTRFKETVKAASENKQPNVVDILLSMKHDFPPFVCAALRAVWLPCSNVDSERCFSSYGTVLTDKRHNLLEENSEIMTMFSFNKSV